MTLGYNIVNETLKYAPQYVGNKLNCSACHFSGGVTQDGKNGGLSLVGEAAKYPTLHGGKVTDLVERVNSCFLKSENGTPPAPDSEDMTAIITYLHWISKGIPVYADIPWLGIKLLQSSHTADKANGQKVFTEVCSVCHGVNGEGNPAIVIDGVSPPPLYGPDSYNDGAGMSKPEVLAAFAYDNMPFKAPSLTVDEAIDVGAYTDNQTRPHYTGP
ncbi:MAG: c-type cytochrome [Dehalococcoidia bacterium]